jgi:predicted small metal-binding protein
VVTKCKGCGIELVAPDEEQLIDEVQAHIAEAHPHGHAPTRDHIRAVIRSRNDERG